LQVYETGSRLTELLLYDNSEDADPGAGVVPEPKLILHVRRGTIVKSCDLSVVPEWAKPIIMAALKAN
jgi:hypothetical protein